MPLDGADQVSTLRTAIATRPLYDERDRQRGYVINLKMVVLAYLTEAVIAGASLIGAVIFAQMYGRGDRSLMKMMMLAPIGYAVVEVSRVPLALAVRTQTSFMLRVVALIGVLCAAGVTVKSMSQLGEIMFRPRMMEVMQARHHLDAAIAQSANLDRQIDDAERLITQRGSELQSAEHQLALSTEKLGGLPEQRCLATSYETRDGRTVKGMKCSPDTRIAALTGGMATARAERDAAQARVAEARAARARLGRVAVDQQLASARSVFQEAVLNSQLHAFTAMVFGKDPSEVTDSELHRFLRIFVFLPAICSALAATLVAMAAVTTVPPDETVMIDDAASTYILGPLAGQIIQKAVDTTKSTMRASVTPRPSLVPNAERQAS